MLKMLEIGHNVRAAANTSHCGISPTAVYGLIILLLLCTIQHIDPSWVGRTPEIHSLYYDTVKRIIPGFLPDECMNELERDQR